MLNLYSLKYFQDAVIEKNLTAAARKNNVSPSAISQAIRQLESHFDVQLLEHGKNKFTLTEQGQFLAKQSQSILDAVKAVEQRVTAFRKAPLSGTIVFATQQSIATHVLPQLLKVFSKNYPEVAPHFRLGTSTVVESWIADATVDFALSLDNVSYENGVSEPVYRGKFVFVSRKNLMAPTRKTIKDREFLTTSSTEVLKLKKAFKQEYGTELPIRMTIDSWSTIKRFCLEGESLGFVPDYLIERGDSLQVFDPKKFNLPEFSYSLCIVRRIGKSFSPIEQKFMETLRGYLAQK